MKATIRDFRGVERAEITAAPIALVAGKNFAGKSSICLAIAAALTGNVIPYMRPGKDGKPSAMLTKSQAGALVRGGSDIGKVVIEDGDSTLTLKWPEGKLESSGENPPHASVYAAGLISVPDLDDKMRATLLGELLDTLPTKADLTDALPIYTPEQIDKIWKKIEIDGWDNAAKEVREHGARLKGQWEGATGGERYGATKSAGWIPAGWDETLAGSSEDALASAVTEAKHGLETMIADTATSEAQVAQLKQTIADAANLPDLTEACAKARKEHEEAVAARDALPPLLKDQETCECPHCEQAVVVVQTRKGYDLQMPTKKIGKAEHEKRSEAIDSAIVIVNEKRLALEGFERDIAKQNALREMAERAKARLDEINAKAAKRPSETAMNEAREAVRIAEDRLRMFTAKTTADKLHASIERNQIVIDTLAADGLRKRRLVRALEAFNTTLETYTKAAGFKVVTVDEDMNIRLGGRPYALLSASEQYRVRAVFQVALAVKDGSSVVILDGADILDGPGRNGLLNLLGGLRNGRHFIVGMTFNKPEQVPDLSASNLGESYWMDAGICRSLSKPAEAQVA